MANDDPFAPDQAVDASPDSARRKKLSLYGLQGLASASNDDSSTLQDKPLYGGDISKSTSSAAEAAGVNEPSQLDTSRVERAPAAALESSPLLGPQERLGNVIDEADRGEEGSTGYGPMSASQRSASLKSLFGLSGGAVTQNALGPSEISGAVPTELKQAKQAYGYANQLDQYTGGNVRSSLKDLLFGSGGGERGATGGQSLSDAVRSGSSSGAGAGAGVTGDLFAGFEELPVIIGEGVPGITANVAGTGAGAAGSETGSTAAGTAAGSSTAAASGIVAAYQLAKLAATLAYGEGPSSGNEAMDWAMGFLGPVGDVGSALTHEYFEPSYGWRSFGQRLGTNLSNEQNSLRNLALNAQNVKTRGDVQQLANLFQQAIQTGIPSYQLGAPDAGGAPQIGGLPGATGKRHEWGLEANFDEPVGQMNQYLRNLYNALPEGEASPLSFGAFNWGEGLGDEGYNTANDIEAQMMSGQKPDLSGYSPRLQDLINHNYQRASTAKYYYDIAHPWESDPSWFQNHAATQ